MEYRRETLEDMGSTGVEAAAGSVVESEIQKGVISMVSGEKILELPRV